MGIRYCNLIQVIDIDICTIENEGNTNMNLFNNKIYYLYDFYSTINCIHFVEFLGGDTYTGKISKQKTKMLQMTNLQESIMIMTHS